MAKILTKIQTKTQTSVVTAAALMLAIGVVAGAFVEGAFIMAAIGAQPVQFKMAYANVNTSQTPVAPPSWYYVKPFSDYDISPTLSVNDNIAVYCQRLHISYDPDYSCIPIYSRLNNLSDQKLLPMPENSKTAGQLKIANGYLFWLNVTEEEHYEYNDEGKQVWYPPKMIIYARPLSDVDNASNNIVVLDNYVDTNFFGRIELLDVNNEYIFFSFYGGSQGGYRNYIKKFTQLAETSPDAFQQVPDMKTRIATLSKDYITYESYESVDGKSTGFLTLKPLNQLFDPVAPVKKISMNTNEGPFFLVSNHENNLVAYTTPTFDGYYKLVVVNAANSNLSNIIIRSIPKASITGNNYPHGVGISSQYLAWYEGLKLYYLKISELYTPNLMKLLDQSKYIRPLPLFSVDKNWLLFFDRQSNSFPNQDRLIGVKF